MIIIAGQVLLFFAIRLNPHQVAGFTNLLNIVFLPGKVLDGEVWRLFTFVFYPPMASPIFVIFYWYLFYVYGTTLEQTWGVFKYNIFLLTACIAHVIVVVLIWLKLGDAGLILAQFTAPDRVATGLLGTNALLFGTVFLAFARYFPDFILNVFFILPIRIKWLALILWIAYGYVLLRANWPVKLLIAAALLNYFLYFGREHIREWKQGHRHRVYQSKVKAAAKQIQHECRVCGLNSEDSPKTLFRYCSKCDGQCCYCPEHIQDHEHVTG